MVPRFGCPGQFVDSVGDTRSDIAAFTLAGHKPVTGQYAPKVCNIATRIGGRNADNIAENHKQGQVFQGNAANQEQVYLAVRIAESTCYQYSNNGCRSAQQKRAVNHLAENRQGIVSQQIEQSSGQSADKVKPKQLFLREVIEENPSEPIEDQQVEKYMQEIEMEKHVGNQRPGLLQQQRDSGGKFEPPDKRVTGIGEKKNYINHPECQKNDQVHIYQPGNNRPLTKRFFYFFPDFHSLDAD